MQWHRQCCGCRLRNMHSYSLPPFVFRQLAEADCLWHEALLQEDFICMQDLLCEMFSLLHWQYNGTGNVVDFVSITCIFTVTPFSLQTTCRSWLHWPWGAGRRKTSSPCRTWCARCSAFCTGSTTASVSWWWRWRRPTWSAWRTVRTSPSCWRPWASFALCSWCRLGMRRRSWWRTAWSERWSLVLPPLHLSPCWVTTVLGPSVWSGLPFSVRHSQTLYSFKSQLKVHLFSFSYS